MKTAIVAALALCLVGCDRPLKVELAGQPAAPAHAETRYQLVAAPTESMGLPAAWRMDVTTGMVWYCTASPTYGQDQNVACRIEK